MRTNLVNRGPSERMVYSNGTATVFRMYVDFTLAVHLLFL